MRASLALSVSLLALMPFNAKAYFEMQGSAPSSTLPAFQSQATYAGAANPANYYAASGAPQNLQPQANLQPSYANPRIYSDVSYAVQPLAGNGADPGVGPVVIEGKAPQAPVVIEGKAPQGVQFQQVGYGYGSATYDAAAPYNASSAALDAQGQTGSVSPAGYGSTNGATSMGATSSAPGSSSQYNATYGNYQNAPQPYGAMAGSANSYGGPGASPQYGSTYAPTPAPQPSQGYGASSYGMSGYAPAYGGGANTYQAPGMLGQVQPAPQAYAAPQPQPQMQQPGYGASTYSYNSYASPNASSAYGSYSSGGYGTAPAAPVTSNDQPYAAPTPYASSPDSTSAYSSYSGSSGYAMQQPQPSAAYPQQYAAPPQPQAYGAPAYGAQGYGAYAAPYPQQQPQTVYTTPAYGAPAYGSPQPAYGNYGSQPQPVVPQNYYGGPQSSNSAPPAYSAVEYNTSSSAASRSFSQPVSMAAVPFSTAGWYAALKGGISFPQDTSFSSTTGDFKNEYNVGWALGGAVGYSFPSFGWAAPRAEMEVSHHMASIDQQTVGAVTANGPAAFGTADTWRIFANGYLDINTPWRRIMTPYIGGGFGFGIADLDRQGTGASGVEMSDSDGGLAFNLAGGFSFPLGRSTNFDVGYRYWRVMDLELTALDGTKSGTGVGSHEITFALRQKL